MEVSLVTGIKINSTRPVAEISNMFEECFENDEYLNEWKQGYIDSIESQLAKGWTMSTTQVETLERIWQKIQDRAR